MSDKLNKDGFVPGQLMSQADQVKYEAQKREKAKEKAKPKAKASTAKSADADGDKS